MWILRAVNSPLLLIPLYSHPFFRDDHFVRTCNLLVRSFPNPRDLNFRSWSNFIEYVAKPKADEETSLFLLPFQSLFWLVKCSVNWSYHWHPHTCIHSLHSVSDWEGGVSWRKSDGSCRSSFTHDLQLCNGRCVTILQSSSRLSRQENQSCSDGKVCCAYPVVANAKTTRDHLK